jgi:hypothetical protein
MKLKTFSVVFLALFLTVGCATVGEQGDLTPTETIQQFNRTMTQLRFSADRYAAEADRYCTMGLLYQDECDKVKSLYEDFITIHRTTVNAVADGLEFGAVDFGDYDEVLRAAYWKLADMAVAYGLKEGLIR